MMLPPLAGGAVCRSAAGRTELALGFHFLAAASSGIEAHGRHFCNSFATRLGPSGIVASLDSMNDLESTGYG